MRNALGTVETRSLVAAVKAADTMLKTSKVDIWDFRIVGSGLVAVIISGDVAAVQAAVDSGKTAAEAVGEVVSYNVIPNPNEELAKLIE